MEAEDVPPVEVVEVVEATDSPTEVDEFEGLDARALRGQLQQLFQKNDSLRKSTAVLVSYQARRLKVR
jgi:hypothetical protein